jgi:hypothetical protein
VVFGSTSPSICTVSGSTVSMLAAGTCALTANQAGNSNYNAAPQVTLNVTIATRNQTITNFTATPSSPTYSSGVTLTTSATNGPGTAALVFGFASTSICTVTGTAVSMLGAGTCALTASQAGDSNYKTTPLGTFADRLRIVGHFYCCDPRQICCPVGHSIVFHHRCSRKSELIPQLHFLPDCAAGPRRCRATRRRGRRAVAAES